MRRIILIFMVLLNFSVLLYTQEYKIITHELKPFTWKDDKKGAMQGIVYEMCEETVTRMGYDNHKIEIYPFNRALKLVEEENNIILFHIARTAEREKQIKWVGPIISNGVYFYKNKSSKFDGKTIEDFKNLESIGVGIGNASETFLIKKGFKNLKGISNEMQAIQMLALNRVDAVPVGEMVVNELASQALVDADILEKTEVKLMESQLYIGFSKNIDDREIKRWQETFEAVKKEKYDILYKKYISGDKAVTK